MAYLEWSKKLDTGIDVIDGQHKRIVEYINKLYEARVNKDMEAVGDVIDETIDYTLSHFGFEEALMEEAGYQFAGPHKRVHDLFAKRVADLQLRFKAGDDVSEEMHKLLSRWLFSHIGNDDASYVPTVKANIHKFEHDQSGGGWLSRSITKFFGSNAHG